MSETRAVAKAVVLHDGKLLALRRTADDWRRPLQWDLPGGNIEAGEDIKAACVREIAEEAGITIAAGDCHIVYAMTEPVETGISVTFTFFLASTDQAEVTLSEEHGEYAWLTLDEALEQFEYERHKRVLTYIRDHDLLAAITSD